MPKRERDLEKRKLLHKELEKTPRGKVHLATLRWIKYCQMNHCYISLSFEAIHLLRQMALTIAQAKIYIRTQYFINQEHVDGAYTLFNAWEVRCEIEGYRVVLDEEARDWFGTQFAELFADADASTARPLSYDVSVMSQMRH